MKFSSTVMAFALSVIAFFAPDAAAQLIDPSVDLPANLVTATNGEGSIRRIIVTNINWALGFLGLIGVISVIYAGFLYLTSQGDDAAAGKARTIILYAVIGIIIIFLSYAIVNTVLSIATGQPAI